MPRTAPSTRRRRTSTPPGYAASSPGRRSLLRRRPHPHGLAAVGCRHGPAGGGRRDPSSCSRVTLPVPLRPGSGALPGVARRWRRARMQPFCSCPRLLARFSLLMRPPSLGNGMVPAAARALADLLLARDASTTPIWVNPDALRRGGSAPRYAACLGATTIGAYVNHASRLHRASPTRLRGPTFFGPLNGVTFASS